MAAKNIKVGDKVFVARTSVNSVVTTLPIGSTFTVENIDGEKFPVKARNAW